jgi:hypothetical protein
MDPRTKREQEIDDFEVDENEFPSEDPYDQWEDDGGAQHETLDGMD